MAKKSTYEELEQRVKELEKEILEHKRAEEAMRKSEELFRTIVETAPSLLIICDTKGNNIYVSPNCEEIFGYTQEELRAEPIWWVHEDDTPRAKYLYDRTFSKGLGYKDFEYKAVKKNGELLYASSSWEPLRNAEGKFKGIVFQTIDVTERKLAEEALLRSEQKFKDLTEMTTDWVWEVDRQGIYTYASPKIKDILGYEVSQVLGKTPFDLMPEEEAERIRKIFNEKVIDNEPFYGLENVNRHKDGHSVVLETNGIPIFDEKGQLKGYRGIDRDITDRVRAQEALKSQLELERLVANVSTSFINTSPDNIDHVINRALETIGIFSGVDRSYVFLFYDNGTKMDNTHEWCAEGIEPQIDNLKGLSVDVIPWWMDKLNQFENIHIPCVSALPPEANAEKEILQSQDIQSLVVVAMVYGGSLIGFLGFDSVRVEKTWSEESITLLQLIAEIFANALEHKRAEEERKQLEAQFQQAQKMESIGTLAGGIAHDFNNVLMGIQGHASLILLDTDPDHPHFERLKGIENIVQTGAGLTNQLLGFARGGKYDVKPTDLNELVGKSSEMFGRTKREIRIHNKYQKDIWPVEVDRGQIDQVLLNLYVNAWHAMPVGGDLYIETSNAVLDEKHTRPFGVKPGNYVKISVTDTGIGMDEATLQRIFEPFFTTKEMGRGTGLGLAFAHGIIKNHGGIIDIDSKKDKGTTFDIYLPASKKEVTIKEKKLEDEILRGTETVLFVDDEDMILHVGKDIFREMGYNVLLAGSGKEAVEVYRKHKDKIDLVILDMIMPDMGGGEAYDIMKEDAPGVKVLLSSGYSIDGQVTEILKRGCDGFIQKPFNVKELSRKVREILDKK
jgi:PAS domain S-box-containing protein